MSDGSLSVGADVFVGTCDLLGLVLSEGWALGLGLAEGISLNMDGVGEGCGLAVGVIRVGGCVPVGNCELEGPGDGCGELVGC